MKRFLRNALIGVVILLLLVAVFWRSLVATATWGVVTYNTWGTSTAEPLVTSEVLLATATTTTSTEFNSLSIPFTFSSTTVLNETDSIIVIREVAGNKYFLVSPITSFANSLKHGSSKETCAEYNVIFSSNPCGNNQQFLRALFSHNINDTHLFSSRSLKNTTAIFKTFRIAYLPNQTSTVTPVHSTYITGYVAKAGNRSIAYLFDIYDVGYELTFINMTDEEIYVVLSGLVLNTVE